jgi:3alpha(or 20beta)-hydroxysteroid dehydrogenase
MPKQISLRGHKALITGGARAIGAKIADVLTESGAAVMIADILDELGREIATHLSTPHIKAGFIHLDVTDDDQWENAVADTIRQLGGLDILINNAGVEFTSLITDIDPINLRQMLDVNVVGPLLGMKHAFRAMRPGGSAGKGGVIINISSVAATVAYPALAGYSASKSAIDRMTRVAAAEAGKLGYGIRVNCIYPGLIANEMGMHLAQDIVALELATDIQTVVNEIVSKTALGKLVEMSDVADAVVFLCSDAAKSITGAGLPVDAGYIL